MKPSCKHYLISIWSVVVVLIWEAYANASRCAGNSPGHHFQFRRYWTAINDQYRILKMIGFIWVVLLSSFGSRNESTEGYVVASFYTLHRTLRDVPWK
jgi:hypothetical protein